MLLTVEFGPLLKLSWGRKKSERCPVEKAQGTLFSLGCSLFRFGKQRQYSLLLRVYNSPFPFPDLIIDILRREEAHPNSPVVGAFFPPARLLRGMLVSSLNSGFSPAAAVECRIPLRG